MPRWEPNAVGRLQDAAIELFESRGLERTTVAEIARAAGLSERTFFNHFASKAEVLFGPRAERHRHVVVAHIAAAGAGDPLEAVVSGLQAAADELFEGLRAASVRRRRIIEASAALREREDAKRTELTTAIAIALRSRGLEANAALMTARAGVLLEQAAEERWSQPEESRPFRAVLQEALVSLRDVLATSATPAGELDTRR